MAFIKFSVTTIETNLKEQSIYLYFSKQIDTDTVSQDNIIVVVQDGRNSSVALYDIIVSDDLKGIQLKLTDAPVVNKNYTVLIQDSIKDLEGISLDKSLFRAIVFKSTVTAEIILLSPANFEVLESLSFSWQETGDNPVNNYRLQISDDTGFHNLLVDAIISGKTTVELNNTLSDKTQYFYRVRAEIPDNFGIWSEKRTFFVQAGTERTTDVSVMTETDVISDISISDLTDQSSKLTIIHGPANGEIPENFSFLFSDSLDISDLEVSVLRRDL